MSSRIKIKPDYDRLEEFFDIKYHKGILESFNRQLRKRKQPVKQIFDGDQYLDKKSYQELKLLEEHFDIKNILQDIGWMIIYIRNDSFGVEGKDIFREMYQRLSIQKKRLEEIKLLVDKDVSKTNIELVYKLDKLRIKIDDIGLIRYSIQGALKMFDEHPPLDWKAISKAKNVKSEIRQRKEGYVKKIFRFLKKYLSKKHD